MNRRFGRSRGIRLLRYLNHKEPRGGDYVHATVKVGLNLVPHVGGALAELFAFAVAAPLERRREDWTRRIAEGLEELQQRFEGFDPKQLPSNDAFVSTAYQATQAVMRTHHEEKREALRNAVLNSALRADLDEDLQQTFVDLIDTLTPWHLRLLRRCHVPHNDVDHHVERLVGSSVPEVVESLFPELKGERERYEQLIAELETHGLILIEVSSTMKRQSRFADRSPAPAPDNFILHTSPLGDSFLQFISSPFRETGT